MIRGLLIALVVIVACRGPDEVFSDIVRKYLTKGGPSAACCISYNGGKPSPECAARAETACAYAKDATLSTRVERQHDDNDALVYVDLAGPAGRGTCTFRVSNFGSPKGRGLRIQTGECRAAP